MTGHPLRTVNQTTTKIGSLLPPCLKDHAMTIQQRHNNKKSKNNNHIADSHHENNYHATSKPRKEHRNQRRKTTMMASKTDKRHPELNTYDFRPIVVLQDDVDDHDVKRNGLATITGTTNKPSMQQRRLYGKNKDHLKILLSNGSWVEAADTIIKHDKRSSSSKRVAVVNDDWKENSLCESFEDSSNESDFLGGEVQRTKVWNAQLGIYAFVNNIVESYTVRIPITSEGLMVNLTPSPRGLVFYSYARDEKNTVGYSERHGLFRARGDLIIGVDGKSCVGLSCLSVMAMLKCRFFAGQKWKVLHLQHVVRDRYL